MSDCWRSFTTIFLLFLIFFAENVYDPRSYPPRQNLFAYNCGPPVLEMHISSVRQTDGLKLEKKTVAT
ncbi:Ovule protein [Caenorhabditis elegans]|uniref:Ovule protein n=1 Tax=Caenorhabditis elegans TaxID=6239 RepID=D5MCU9_CAEEL|nr:Ovule protein [Caenorhabditis elegans]CBL43466.1 Ovule protein [Caenorhabditis elegans]|eukprot:NP_001256800.1 Uncharacterized protein CELE_ZK228.13 [Caenorhabditis elegans]